MITRHYYVIIKFRNGSMTISAECTVCTDQLTNEDTLSACPCGHVFHEKCLSLGFLVDLSKIGIDCSDLILWPTKVFHVDYNVEIRSGPSITVFERTSKF